MEEIVKTVATFYNVYYKTLMLPGRSKKNQVIAKQMAFVLIGDFLPSIGVHEIGCYFNRDHSTIVTGRKVLRQELEVDKRRRLEYEKLFIIIEGLNIPHVSMYCKPKEIFV